MNKKTNSKKAIVKKDLPPAKKQKLFAFEFIKDLNTAIS